MIPKSKLLAGIEVIELSVEDAGEIEALFMRVWPDAWEYPEEWRRKRTLKRKQIVDEMERGYHYFGIKMDNRLVGVYKAIITEDGLFGEHLSIDPTYRGQGLATAMYHHIIQFARNNKCKKVYVNILANKIASERIVQKLGFRKKGQPYEQVKGMLVQMYEKEV